MKAHYPPPLRKARSKRVAGKTPFTHNSGKKNHLADSDEDLMNTGENVVLTSNRFPHNSRAGMRESEKLSPTNLNGQISLDKLRGKPGIRPHEYQEILGRAEHYRMILSQVNRINPKDKGNRLWDRMQEPLLKARTEEEVTKAVERFGAPYSRDFVPHLSQQIFKTLRDPRFPKGPDAQINFLADSIAALRLVPVSLSQQILKTLRDPRFPKGPDAQANFLADSIAALRLVPGSNPVRQVSLSQQISKTLRDPRFPKGPDAQANFLADSIAALILVPGSNPVRQVSPRRSRNICQEQRKRQRRQP